MMFQKANIVNFINLLYLIFFTYPLWSLTIKILQNVITFFFIIILSLSFMTTSLLHIFKKKPHLFSRVISQNLIRSHWNKNYEILYNLEKWMLTWLGKIMFDNIVNYLTQISSLKLFRDLWWSGLIQIIHTAEVDISSIKKN